MSQRWRLIGGVLGATLGGLLVLAGLVVLLGQVGDYVDTLQWSGYSLLELSKSPSLKATLPGAVQSWLHRPEGSDGFQAALIGLLETVPAVVFFIGLGGVMLRKALR